VKLPARLSNVLFVCVILAFLGSCDSYNLPLDKFLNGSPAAADDETAGSAKAITAFTITNPASTGVINEPDKTIAVTVPYGTDVTGLTPNITHTGADIIPASGEAQDFTGSVSYTVTAADGTDQTYTVTVTVASASAKAITAFTFTSPGVTGDIDEAAKTIAVTVPYGTDVTGLIPTITHTGADIDPAPGVSQDFTGPINYTVTAADHSTVIYKVTVTVALNSAKAITAFNFPSPVNGMGDIDEGDKTITVTVPYGTDVTGLIPAITVSPGASVNPASGEAQNFTNPVSYKVTAADGTTQTYEVTVTAAPNSVKTITAFTFPSPVNATGNINEGAKTITVTVPYGTDVTGLIPTITVSPGASVNPASGAAQDFTNPVPYKVTAGDGTDQTYTVTVMVALNPAKAITTFSFPSPVNVTGNINEGAKTIAVTVPYGTVVTGLIPAITVSPGASVSPLSGAARDFTTPVDYIVTAADDSTVTYTVTVTVGSFALNNVADIAAWIDEQTALGYGTAANPIVLPLAVNLDSVQWADILSAIAFKSKYVALDLTDCTGGIHSSGGGLYGNGTFDPGIADTGEQYITALTLPNAATSTSNSAFRYFTGLKEINGENVISVGNFAFQSCTSLTSVDFPEATWIGWAAFSQCTALTTVSLSKATYIGYEAFGNCTSLTTVSLLEAINIDVGAFSGCTGLTSVTLPASLSNVGDNPFAGCIGLTNISVDAGNTNFSASGGMFMNKAGTTLIAYPTASASVTLNDITNIGSSAFYGCTGLTSVTLPEATTIGDSAFRNCTNLISVTLSEATTIGSSAFYVCTSLTSVTLPEATIIGGSAFGNCTSLTTVSLLEAININDHAFSECTGLTTVNLPKATYIGGSAFGNCTNLTTVNLPKATIIGGQAFSYTGSTTLTVTLGATPPTLEGNMFNSVSSKNVTVNVPSGAPSAYGPVPVDTTDNNWANGFRGGGWNGSSMPYSSGVNGNINLMFTIY
jgi:hypothetical protein